MTDFTSLLSSLGGQSKGPQPQTSGARQATQGPRSRTLPPVSSTQLVASNAVAGVKRKAEASSGTAVPKATKPSLDNTANRTSTSGTTNTSAARGAAAAITPNVPYRGTARASRTPTIPKLSAKTLPVAASRPGILNAPPKPASTTPGAAGKRGFASIMEKAKAAQEAAKASGTSGIKHKPVERLTKRERKRQQEEAAQKPKTAGKASTSNANKSGVPADPKADAKKKAPETSYKGTMKKPPEQLAYKGTMRALGPGAERPKAPNKKGMGQDKYGGYASWSDLDEADDQDEEEEAYESEASSDMEAGWGDTEREELSALKYAKQEDQEALQEEERLKQEKLERKRKLLQLSKSNAARKKY